MYNLISRLIDLLYINKYLLLLLLLLLYLFNNKYKFSFKNYINRIIREKKKEKIYMFFLNVGIKDITKVYY